MVEVAGFVNQDRPVQPGITRIVLHERTALKRHNGNPDTEPAKCAFLLPQLRQMLTAGQSSQMSVEHQQQPAAGKILQGMPPILVVP